MARHLFFGLQKDIKVIIGPTMSAMADYQVWASWPNAKDSEGGVQGHVIMVTSFYGVLMTAYNDEAGFDVVEHGKHGMVRNCLAEERPSWHQICGCS